MHAEVDVRRALVSRAEAGVGVDVVIVVAVAVRVCARHQLRVALAVHTRVDVADFVRLALVARVRVGAAAGELCEVVVGDAGSAVLADQVVSTLRVGAVSRRRVGASGVLVSVLVAHAVRVTTRKDLTASVAMTVDVLVEAGSRLAVGAGDSHRAVAVCRATDAIDDAGASVQTLADVRAGGRDVAGLSRNRTAEAHIALALDYESTHIHAHYIPFVYFVRSFTCTCMYIIFSSHSLVSSQPKNSTSSTMLVCHVWTCT